MKKILVMVVILLTIGLVVLAVFIATFDADRYRPILVKEMKTALGRPVRLERISLGWQTGVALELKNLVVESDEPAKEPLAKIENLRVTVRLMPLLKKEIQIVSVVILRPDLHLRREASGAIAIDGLFPLPQQPSDPPGSSADPKVGPPAVALPLFISEVKVEDGTLHITDAQLKPPWDLTIHEINLDVQNISLVPPGSLEIEQFAAKIGEGSITGAGTIDNLFTKPKGNLQVTAQRVGLETLLPAPNPGGPALRGNLSGSFQVGFEGAPGPEILRSLTGQGHLSFSDGLIVNLNILREIFQRISIIPGLSQGLNDHLPESYKEKFAAQDTVFQAVDLAFALEGGAISFNNLKISTDTFELTGSGRVGLDGAVAVQSQVRIDPQLSAAIIQSVQELQFLSDSQGRLELPVIVQGNLPQVTVVPDLGYVASHLAATKVEDLVGGLLQKLVDKGS